jgi:two-component system chemotaxis response regulator CheB
MLQRPEAVLIGVSTGGPNALNSVIPQFPATFNLPILLVQHMPPVFTAQLARRLNEKSKLEVVEAKDRDRVRPGTVYIAPGDYHMVVKDNGGRIIRLNQDPPVNSCRPSVDVLFESAVDVYGGRVVAVVMTGMGRDGLDGCKRLKEKGATVVVQNRETCVVWGMPRFVEEAGLADRVCPLDQITPTILDLCGFNRVARPAAAAK